MSFNGALVMAATVVAVDVGRNKAVLAVTSADRRRLFGAAEFAMTAPGLAGVLARVCAALPAEPVKVGVEAAGQAALTRAAGPWPELQISTRGRADKPHRRHSRAHKRLVHPRQVRMPQRHPFEPSTGGMEKSCNSATFGCQPVVCRQRGISLLAQDRDATCFKQGKCLGRDI